jgi:hypothetical protein
VRDDGCQRDGNQPSHIAKPDSRRRRSHTTVGLVRSFGCLRFHMCQVEL